MNINPNYNYNIYRLNQNTSPQHIQTNPSFGINKNLLMKENMKQAQSTISTLIGAGTLAAIAGVEITKSQNKDNIYLKKTSDTTKIFNVDNFVESFSKKYNSLVGKSSYDRFIDIPSTKKVEEIIVDELIAEEKQGIKIAGKDILKLLKELKEEGFDINYKNSNCCIEDICHMENFYTSMFEDLYRIVKNTPKNKEEDIKTYMSRIMELRDMLVKENEHKKINKIKSKLKYDKNNKILPPAPLLFDAKVQIVNEIMQERSYMHLEDCIPKITYSSTDKEVFEAWREFHMCSCHLSSGYLQRLITQFGERYNSLHPPKTIASYDVIKKKNYLSEFKYEPVYSWLDCNDDFILKAIPKEGEIYKLQRELCCSTHKYYAENDCGDHMGLEKYIKLIIHPKSETSRAINMGYHQEVAYCEGEQFKIISKDCIEYINPTNGAVCPRWEVHMQEI